jgi:hypothetical protein
VLCLPLKEALQKPNYDEGKNCDDVSGYQWMVFYLCMIEFLILCTINNTIKFVLLILEISFGLNVAIRFVIPIGRKSTTSDLLCYSRTHPHFKLAESKFQYLDIQNVD